MAMKHPLASLALAALLAGCAAPPTQPAAAPSDASAADEQTRFVRGSTLPVSLNVDTKNVDASVAGQSVTAGSASAGTASSVKPATLGFAADSLQVDSQGFWNAFSVDSNAGSNADFGKDVHVTLALPSDLAGTTMSKLSLENTTTGGSWDSAGYPNHQWVGVYAADGATLLLKGGSTAAISAGQRLELYMDTGNPDTPKNALHAGDVINVTLETAAGQKAFTGLKL
jgi:hypothetical protein